MRGCTLRSCPFLPIAKAFDNISIFTLDKMNRKSVTVAIFRHKTEYNIRNKLPLFQMICIDRAVANGNWFAHRTRHCFQWSVNRKLLTDVLDFSGFIRNRSCGPYCRDLRIWRYCWRYVKIRSGNVSQNAVPSKSPTCNVTFVLNGDVGTERCWNCCTRICNRKKNCICIINFFLLRLYQILMRESFKPWLQYCEIS